MPAIECLYAWVAPDADGGEGVCAVLLDDSWTPLVGADRARIELFRGAARRIQEETGSPVRLVKFSNRMNLGDA